MKLSKALKVFFVTHSLLLSSVPTYAQVKKEKGIFQRFTDYLLGRDAQEDPEAEGGPSRPKRGPVDVNGYLRDPSDPNYYAAPTAQDFVFCGAGVVQEIHLNGISDLVAQVDSMCKFETNDFYNGIKNRGLIGFCGYAVKKLTEGGCYPGLGSADDIKNYESQILTNPRLREKFIEAEKEQLKKERDRMQDLSSFQLMMAQDANTLLDMKGILEEKLKSGDREVARKIRRVFNLNRDQMQSIRKGSISLQELGDALFQCKPDEDFRTEKSFYDRSVLGNCETNEQNDLVKEAYNQLTGGNGKGLMSDLPSELLSLFNKGIIKDDYKSFVNGAFPGIQRFSESEQNRLYATKYQEDASKVISMMDSAREPGKKLELTNVVDSLAVDFSTDEAVKMKKANEASLNITLGILEKSYEGDANGKKILQAFRDNYLVEKDGYQTVDLKEDGAAGALSKIQASLGEEYSNGDGSAYVSEFIRTIVVGSNLGAQMYISKMEEAKLGKAINNSGFALPNNDYDIFTKALENPPEDNLFLKKLSSYFNSSNREPYEMNIEEMIAKLDDSNSDMCKTPHANAVAFKLNLITALASDCNALTKRSPVLVGTRHCPNAGNPKVSELLINDFINNPEGFQAATEDSIRDIYVGCKSVNAETVIFNGKPTGDEEKGSEDDLARYKMLEETCGSLSGPLDFASQLIRGRIAACNFATMGDGDGEGGSYGANDFGFENIINVGGAFESSLPVASVPSAKNDPIGAALEKSMKNGGIFSTGNYTNLSKNKVMDNYNGTLSESPNVGATVKSTDIASAYTTPSTGINSNIFDTKRAINPTKNSTYIPTVDQSKEEKVTSEELRSEMMANNGKIDPNMQKILDRMAAMEANERDLRSQQSQLLAQLNNAGKGGEKSAEDLEAQKKLAEVTKKLEDLQNQIPDLVAKAREKGAESVERKASNFIGPSVAPTPSGGGTGRVANNRSSGTNAAASTYSGGGGGASISSGPSVKGAAGNYSPTVGGSPVSADGISAPAYTKNETFILTKSIRDKAVLVAAGVSIEDAVLQSKGAILVPYGNGEYMYVEPQLNSNGDVETRDGRVVYKEVLKISDPQAIAKAEMGKGRSRGPASIEEPAAPKRKYYLENLNQELDDAQE